MKQKRVVFITGSSKGIGKATALRFAREGFSVIISYCKDKKGANKVKEECKKLGADEVLVLHLDVTKNNSIKKGVKEITNKFGKIDILINNAGVISWKAINELSEVDIESQIRTNLEGLIKVTHAFLPYVKETIVNIASGAGKRAHAGLSTYCATKFGVRGFSQAIALELPRLKIFCVNPGPTATRMTNYQGMDPKKVADVIFKTATLQYKKKSGDDIDVWEHV